jgi:hypothetical protein
LIGTLVAVRAITKDNLGAWLIKCDPEAKFDLPGAIADGMQNITSWSVVSGYRADMMAPNDKTILWVSGNGRRMARGIWGIGRVKGEVEPNDDDEYFSDVNYWLDQDARNAVELFVPVHIPLFDQAVDARDLVGAGVTDLEVQRMPQGSNPSWVSRDQLERLEHSLPAWPSEVAAGVSIAVTPTGAGFGSPAKNAVVEAIAMAEVIKFYGPDWRHQDVSMKNVGWDITFTHRTSREVAKVEVKGVSGSKPIVLLTANEIAAAENEVGWQLAVVTSALSSPKVVKFTADETTKAASPYVYRVRLAD